MNSQQNVQKLLETIYDYALRKADEKQIDWSKFRKEIKSKLKKSKFQFKDIQKFVLYNEQDWLQDVLQITRDIQLVYEQKNSYQQIFHDRANKHFSSANLQKLNLRKSLSSTTIKVIQMYKNSSNLDWNELKLLNLKNTAFQNTVYIIGLTKGNGVIIEGKYILTCAHVFMDDNDQIWKYRSFITGNNSYGLAKIEPNGIWIDKDIAFARIIKFYSKQQKPKLFHLKVPKQIKFKNSFEPIRCIQLGLLFNNDPSYMQIKSFKTAQGFIEKNLYQGPTDLRLVDEMGLLVHDCYGLWGTSGSPLWSGECQLLGIHNSWNQNGYNVAMIVHDDKQEHFRIVKQYERRAISIHVIIDLFEDWKEKIKNLNYNNNDFTQDEIKQSNTIKKKVKQ